MAKIGRVQEVSLNMLRPYERNAKIHDKKQVEQIARSIQEFGFLNPCLIDKDHNIIAGHGRIQAARKLGMQTVPCVYVEGLTEEQRRAYILADNRLTELGTWDQSLVELELSELRDLDFDVSITGFDMNEPATWFDTRERNDTSRQEGNDEYNDFLEKFEQKKTTDDCYTPDIIYEAVADWVAQEYGVKRSDMVRPFYPGGDYEHEEYKPGAVVVDNPPFSILADIQRFYCEHGIGFFLFAPSLTLFSGRGVEVCYIAADADITYENGVTVNTSFITNMEKRYMVMTAPSLTRAVKEANRQNRAEIAKPAMPKYRYPDYVITAAQVGVWAAHCVDFKLPRNSGAFVRMLDAQKPYDKAIYGGGFLLSEHGKDLVAKAKKDTEAAKVNEEKQRLEEIRALDTARRLEAAKEVGCDAGEIENDEETGEIVWPLSEREKEIVRSLSNG